ncbi:actin-like protein arp8 [Entomortierella beljakovae]|nr:actin-like protein arp8 [Entomortierella beljakovae]
MEDVHMEDADAAAGMESVSNLAPTNLPIQPQDSSDLVESTDAIDSKNDKSGDQQHSENSQNTSVSANESSKSDSLTTGENTQQNEAAAPEPAAAANVSMMDLDIEVIETEENNNTKDVQEAKDNSNGGTDQNITSSNVPLALDQEKNEDKPTDSQQLIAESSNSTDLPSTPQESQPKDDSTKDNIPLNNEQKQMEPAVTNSVPAHLLRNYIPQFKFTTFAAMTPLPTRNVTSNFLRTEKNFVLKGMASKRRRRKPKPDDGTIEEGKESEEAAEGEDQTKNEDDIASKKVKKDEFSAIRKGIFAEEDENDTEDKDVLENEDGEDNQKREDSDEYSSDSDSEESVVNETDENGETKSTSDAGKKIIVIHPGSRILRIGRASDAYPVATPHCISRRIHKIPTATVANTENSGLETSKEAEASADNNNSEEKKSKTEGDETGDAEDDNDMDVDGDDDESNDSEVPDVVNDRYLQEIEYDLKLRMKAAKRRPVPNAKTQVKSFNTSTRPERILDHNDPYKVEWTDPASEGEYVIGQKALNLPPSKNHSFRLCWPILGGKLNDRDYTSPRVTVADLETIWTKVIQEDLGIEPNKFKKHYALLVIPDLYNKLYVIEIVRMLLKSMGFRGAMVQQESVCAAFGAGVSAACVVDIGAEVTKIACVEDGICIPNSRAVLKYGGDDITRCFAALVKRTGFPYQELDLAQTYDWKLMEELKEKWCTMNEADLTVQVYNFFVRRPEKHTEKYQVKVYDEVAISPMCLFFPGVIRRWITESEINPTFARLSNYEDINEDAPPISLTNQSQKKNTAAAAIAAAARAGTPSLTVPGDESNINTNGNVTPIVGTPGATPAPVSTPSAAPATPAASVPSSIPVITPFAMEPSVTTTDKSWEIAGTIGKDNFSSLVSLDVVVAQSISNCGSEERSKKLYGSIILVGGGGMIKGFDRVLEDRLFQALPATLTTVEKVEVLPSPRDMDPRLLVWKGASVLGKLETAKEMWIKPLEWDLMGRKILRDKALFPHHMLTIDRPAYKDASNLLVDSNTLLSQLRSDDPNDMSLKGDDWDFQESVLPSSVVSRSL